MNQKRTILQKGHKDFEKTAVHVSQVSIVGNIVLSIVKLLAGVMAHSTAMVSDAVHSASDVFSSIVVIIGIKAAAKEADEDHPYGHERMESVAAIVLAVVLAITGIFIGHSAIEKLESQKIGSLAIPGAAALLAALLSIICKEGMYWYTRHYARVLDSGALMADAWHHRSDALSSIGSLVGIAGARMGYPFLDPVAGLLICFFILKAAYDIFMDAINKMVDHSCSDDTQGAIITYARSLPGVIDIGHFQTREFGNRIYVDLEIVADGKMTLYESNEMAEKIHDAIEAEFPKIKHIVVIMKPTTR